MKRPALRYYSGKWKLAPEILKFFPEHRIYVEPFGGAASLLLRKPRSSYAEVYNDLDGEIVNFFRVLRDNSGELEKLLRLTPFARDEYAMSFQPADNPVEQARRTCIRSFMGFRANALNRSVRSGFRSNSTRSGTIPAHDWATYPEHIASMAARLAGVVIENRNALDVIRQHDTAETLFYVDPPYVHATRMQHAARSGYSTELTDDQHTELAATLKTLKGMVALSGYRCPMYDDLYSGWLRHDLATYADGARPRVESVQMRPLRLAPNCKRVSHS